MLCLTYYVHLKNKMKTKNHPAPDIIYFYTFPVTYFRQRYFYGKYSYQKAMRPHYPYWFIKLVYISYSDCGWDISYRYWMASGIGYEWSWTFGMVLHIVAIYVCVMNRKHRVTNQIKKEPWNERTKFVVTTILEIDISTNLRTYFWVFSFLA